MKSGIVGVISKVDWLWNGGAVMLEFWVDLGEEMEVVFGLLDALISME